MPFLESKHQKRSMFADDELVFKQFDVEVFHEIAKW